MNARIYEVIYHTCNSVLHINNGDTIREIEP
jgi:hypothetical protein